MGHVPNRGEDELLSVCSFALSGFGNRNKSHYLHEKGPPFLMLFVITFGIVLLIWEVWRSQSTGGKRILQKNPLCMPIFFSFVILSDHMTKVSLRLFLLF